MPASADGAGPAPATPDSPFRRMRVKNLSRAAADEGVDLAGCRDKAEMEQLLEDKATRRNWKDDCEANVFVTLDGQSLGCVFAEDGRVARVKEGSEAAAKGLQPNDLIVQVARRPVRRGRLAVAQAFRAHPDRPLHISVYRPEAASGAPPPSPPTSSPPPPPTSSSSPVEKIVHIEGTNHQPIRTSWKTWYEKDCNRDCAALCPCEIPGEPAGTRHVLGSLSKPSAPNKIVGAHVLFRPDAGEEGNSRPSLYAGIVPVCGSCNKPGRDKPGRPIVYECNVATIVDVGAGTWHGRLHKKTEGADGSDHNGPYFKDIIAYARVDGELWVEGTDKGDTPIMDTYKDPERYLESLLAVMTGGLAAHHPALRLAGDDHEARVFTLNRGKHGDVAGAIKSLVKLARTGSLVNLAREGGPDRKEAAARALRGIGYENDTNKVAIATAGGIAPLVALARDGDAGGKEQAAWALGNLSCNADNSVAIAAAGGIALFVALARDGDAGGKEMAAGALEDLTANPKSRTAVAEGLGLHRWSSEFTVKAEIDRLKDM